MFLNYFEICNNFTVKKLAAGNFRQDDFSGNSDISFTMTNKYACQVKQHFCKKITKYSCSLGFKKNI